MPFSEILKQQPNAHLVLIGFGDLESKMSERIKMYGIDSHVENLGRREDIRQFYNAFDAFLLPSLYEGLPVVGLESQSCGLPIFFSTEITQEARACEMAHFIGLDTPVSEWAKTIVEVVKQNIPIRRSYVDEVIAAGFDSESESKRLQNFYMDAIIEQNNK